MIVDIPSWSETDERLGQLQRSDRTIARSVLNGIELDPIEAFVHCQEPGGISQNKEFREKLQAMLDFVAENFNTGQARINQLEQTNATHKEHIQMVEKHRQEALAKAEALAKDKALLVDGLDRINKMIYACGAPVGTSRYFEIRSLCCTLISQVADSKEGETVSEDPYGYCECGAPGVSRERRPNGNDTCKKGHVYPSSSALPF